MGRTPDRFQGRREEESILLSGSSSQPDSTGEFTYLSGSGFLFNDNGNIKSLGIQLPINPATGSLLYFDGNIWTYISGGPEGYSLVSNGPNSIPTWELLVSSTLNYNFISNSYNSNENNISLTGSNIFGSTTIDVHEFTGSVVLNNGITGSLLGTASFSSNAELLNGLNSQEFAKNNTISLLLNGIVEGNAPTLIGTFYILTSSNYSNNSFIYFGGSQANENATIEIKNYDSPYSTYTISKNSTLSITYLTSSLSLNSGLYNIYLYSSGSGTAIAKNLFLSN